MGNEIMNEHDFSSGMVLQVSISGAELIPIEFTGQAAQQK